MIQYENDMNPALCNVKPSGIRKFFSIAEEMDNVISLGVGEPDFLTPWHIRREGIDSLDRGATRYTANAGLLSLRQEICAFYARRYHLQYRAENQVLVTVGGSEGIDMAIRTLVCPGEAAITPKTKLLVFPYPNNPTGAVMRREDLEPICRVLQKHNIYVLSDEIYSELTYGGADHTSIAAMPGMAERTVVINGFSKTYSMTGWRLGYALGPAPIIQQMTKLHQFAIMSAPTTSQTAAIEALRHGDGDIDKMRRDYDMRRRFTVHAFREIGLPCFEPEGAFYLFPCIQSTGLSSEEFCERLIYSKRVAVVPGNAFGDCGEGFIRVSYCYSIENIKEAVTRIGEFVKELEDEHDR